nr:MAG TPA: hypothetical protein [Caudoviricetes sp.]
MGRSSAFGLKGFFSIPKEPENRNRRKKIELP